MALIRVRKLILFPPELVTMVEEFQKDMMLPSFTVSVLQLLLIAFQKIKEDKGEQVEEAEVAEEI